MMATFDEARAALSALLSQYENRRLYKRGSLGNGDGATVEVAGRPGYHWVIMEGDQNKAVQVFNKTTSPIYILYRGVINMLVDAHKNWTYT